MNEAQRAEAALQRYEQAKAELYRADGEPKYGSVEMQERQRNLKARFQDEVDRIEKELNQRIAGFQEQILRLEHADPADSLITAELECANAKRAFVADDAYSLSLTKLTGRLQAVLADDDRPTMFLWAHFAGQRIGEPDPMTDTDESVELREVVGQLMHKLNPERASKLARAHEGIAEAEKAQFEVSLRQGGHRSAVQGWREKERANWVR